jgi:hypothetical protein
MYMRCPACYTAKNVKEKEARGQTCEHCGYDLDRYYFSNRSEKQAIDFIYAEAPRLKALNDRRMREASKTATTFEERLSIQNNDAEIRAELEDLKQMRKNIENLKVQRDQLEEEGQTLPWILHVIFSIGVLISLFSIGGLPKAVEDQFLLLAQIIPASIRYDAGVNNFDVAAIVYAGVFLVMALFKPEIKYKFSKFMALCWVLSTVQYQSPNAEIYFNHLFITQLSYFLFVLISFAVEFFYLVNRKL